MNTKKIVHDALILTAFTLVLGFLLGLVYEITKAISELSEGFLDISQNTIYTAAYKLENDGMITEYSRLVGRKRTRVYYHIEPDGEKYLERMLASYRTTFCGMEKFLSKSIVDLQESKERKKKSE